MLRLPYMDVQQGGMRLSVETSGTFDLGMISSFCCCPQKKIMSRFFRTGGNIPKRHIFGCSSKYK